MISLGIRHRPHVRRTLWRVAAALAVAGALWFSRAAVAEVAFEWSLRTRVPVLEGRVGNVEGRVTQLEAALPAETVHRLVELLEAAEARERARRKR